MRSGDGATEKDCDAAQAAAGLLNTHCVARRLLRGHNHTSNPTVQNIHTTPFTKRTLR